jgi:putative transcriptional regulator
MTIRIKIDQLLLDRRMTLTELAERVGITIANLSVLKTNKARALRLDTLDALCRELRCQPGDLLERTAEPSEVVPSAAPLAGSNRDTRKRQAR